MLIHDREAFNRSPIRGIAKKCVCRFSPESLLSTELQSHDITASMAFFFFMPQIFFSHPPRKERREGSRGGDRVEEVCVCSGGSGGLLHVRTKTFQGKPCQIFITVCGKGFTSPVTHTDWESAKSEHTHSGRSFLSHTHTPQLLAQL